MPDRLVRFLHAAWFSVHGLVLALILSQIGDVLQKKHARDVGDKGVLFVVLLWGLFWFLELLEGDWRAQQDLNLRQPV